MNDLHEQKEKQARADHNWGYIYEATVEEPMEAQKMDMFKADKELKKVLGQAHYACYNRWKSIWVKDRWAQL